MIFVSPKALVGFVLLMLVAAPRVWAVDFPISGVYSQNFDGAIGPEWNLDRWAASGVYSLGVTQVNSGQVRTNDSHIPAFDIGTVSFPLDSVVPAASFLSNGFSGNWLKTSGNASTTTPGIATLTLSNLPIHTSIDLTFLLAPMDSIDGTTGVNADGPFVVRLDGVVIINKQISSGGGNMPGTPGFTTVMSLTNASSNYSEWWQNGATDESMREIQTWTYDSAHSYLSNFTHTASTLVLEFQHSLGQGGSNDEAFAIENLGITLIPEPETLLLLAPNLFLIAAAARRRHPR